MDGVYFCVDPCLNETKLDGQCRMPINAGGSEGVECWIHFVRILFSICVSGRFSFLGMRKSDLIVLKVQEAMRQ